MSQPAAVPEPAGAGSPPIPRPAAWARRCFAPVDIAPLVCFRIAFGAIVLWEIALYFAHGWLAAFWVRPRFHFTYPGFEWVRPWPGGGLYVHGVVLGVLAVGILTGCWYRWCAALFCVGVTYLFLLDQATYQNHLYLICLVSLLLACVPAHRRLSLDVRRRPALRADTVPAWTLWLLRAQFALVYVFAAIAKMNPDWLRGEPLRGWLATRPDIPILGPLLHAEALAPVFAYASLGLDVLAVPALLWRRTRVAAIGVLLAFHLVNAQLFDLGVFPWLMIAATALFAPPEWFRLGPRPQPAADQVAPGPLAAGRIRTLALIAVYLSVQVLVPLRHLLYPGNPSWTDEGQTFAWRMLVREKRGEVSFEVVDPVRHLRWGVELWRHVTPFQRRKMATNPDLILQLAHRVAAQQRKQGRGVVQVYARATAALNDHPRQWLVDPRVDLAATPRTLGPAPWIVPLGGTVPGFPEPPGVRGDAAPGAGERSRPAAPAGAGTGIVPEGARRRREWAPDDSRTGPHD